MKTKRKVKLMKGWMHKTENASSEILIMSIIETLVKDAMQIERRNKSITHICIFVTFLVNRWRLKLITKYIILNNITQRFEETL